ncbi:putative amidoligase enzyme [Penicillium brevicompactum]|uniref:amidoligase enzyme-domain-containing protein n=1 Tax=Penicillium brevicompactum TaxID=5074 RepID=UPI00254240D6|nr:amidoligase enzyme-domain-containing protein [Penicillium brevicompactum]KAJ5333367.1 amidoligase enzyme-domain-containing protein [Penicillium brevicompactum]
MYSRYRVGIEIEFILKPINFAFDPLGKVRAVVAQIISECNPHLRPTAQLRNKVDKPCRRPEFWSLKTDNSVVSYEWNTLPLELVSPVLTYDETNAWRDDLHEIFRVLKTVCEIKVNPSCGVHIHISRIGEPWKLETLKELSRNAMYFEKVIDSLLPRHRVGNELLQSSRYHSLPLEGRSMLDCVFLVNDCVSVPHLVELMNFQGSRYFAWNLTNMLDTGRQTVEFRQPPGMDTAEAVLQWVEFVVLFLHAAKRSTTLSILCNTACSLAGLRWFLSIYKPVGYDSRAVDELLSASFEQKQRWLEFPEEGRLAEQARLVEQARFAEQVRLAEEADVAEQAAFADYIEKNYSPRS